MLGFRALRLNGFRALGVRVSYKRSVKGGLEGEGQRRSRLQESRFFTTRLNPKRRALNPKSPKPKPKLLNPNPILNLSSLNPTPKATKHLH